MQTVFGWNQWSHPLTIWRDKTAQDLIEYALLAAFLAVAVAAFFPTDIAPNVSAVFSKIVYFLAQTPP